MDVSLRYIACQKKKLKDKKLDLTIILMDLDISSARPEIWDFQVKLSSNTTQRTQFHWPVQ